MVAILPRPQCVKVLSHFVKSSQPLICKMTSENLKYWMVKVNFMLQHLCLLMASACSRNDDQLWVLYCTGPAFLVLRLIRLKKSFCNHQRDVRKNFHCECIIEHCITMALCFVAIISTTIMYSLLKTSKQQSPFWNYNCDTPTGLSILWSILKHWCRW